MKRTGRRVRSGRSLIVENDWTCTSCGVVNPGAKLFCACGSPKEKEEKDVQPADLASRVVTDPEAIRIARAGKDLVCIHCGGKKRRADGTCNGCGALLPLDTPEPKTEDTEHSAPPVTPRNTGRGGLHVLAALGVSLILIAFVALVVYLVMPHQKNLTVSQLSWAVIREVEQRQVNHGEGWGTKPGAYNASCHERQSDTEDCDPYDCNPHPEECNCKACPPCGPDPSCSQLDNGYSECPEVCDECCDECTVYDTCYKQCPVYDDWCTYKYDTWPTVAKKETYGEGHTVIFPSLQAQGSNQRLKEYRHFIVTFVDPATGKTYAHNTSDQEDYSRFDLNETWQVTTRLISNSCTPVVQL